MIQLLGESKFDVGVARRVAYDFGLHIGWPHEHPNMVAVGFGMRGQKAQPSLIVQMMACHSGDVAPRRLPSTFGGFSIVQERGGSVLTSHLADRLRRGFGGKPLQAWPGWPGSAVRAASLRRAGTLGCYVQCRTGGGYALSCEHIFASHVTAPAHGTVVMSYAPGRPNGREIVLGHIDRERAGNNPFDCTLIKVELESRCVNVVPQIGRLVRNAPALDDVPLGTLVCKYGAASGYSVGVVTALQNVRQRGDADHPVGIRGVLEVRPVFDGKHRFTSFCTRGDSGAVVAFQVGSREAVPMGLLVSRGTLLEAGYVIGLAEILESLQVRIA